MQAFFNESSFVNDDLDGDFNEDYAFDNDILRFLKTACLRLNSSQKTILQRGKGISQDY